MAEDWNMDDLHSAFLAELEKGFADHDLDDREVQAAIGRVFEEVLSSQVIALGKDLAAREQDMLVDRRAEQQGFVERNLDRWKEGFDKLERLIVMSEELGAAIASVLGAAASENNDALYEALVSNHARAVLTAREILCLMMNGFPDGALARWRTLHEVAIISQFISKHGTDTAEAFIEHRHWLSYQRALNYQNHHERAKLTPFEGAELADLKELSEMVLAKRGPDLASDYGWAAAALGKRRPKFSDLEAVTGLDHWRPRYKWSSTVNHGAYLAPLQGLGTSETVEAVRLVGQSNSGMTDPGHMTAITLTHATLPVLMMDPNLDRMAIFKIMLHLSDEIGDAFVACSEKPPPDTD
ncbi:hypothetical protein BV97_04645 [Novosphingobium resinovorum]|uniref:Uncharacterized protein n=1 Tax=Novosphingobium resinovorum TaxID=158500 RepID=A0A031JPX4_9SPHN|nr:DUF5677 domain-containing protein [Novosphingobium resinovorum]EZP74907.1 hypothetical protein BV97_04645 [Novosphingobium resinovorum]